MISRVARENTVRSRGAVHQRVFLVIVHSERAYDYHFHGSILIFIKGVTDLLVELWLGGYYKHFPEQGVSFQVGLLNTFNTDFRFLSENEKKLRSQ